MYTPPDYIRIPKGTLIKDVPMDFEGEEKLYDIVTQDEGAFMIGEVQKDLFRNAQ